MEIGIIPARAGFTADGRVLCGGGEDHPRSRGVYPRRSPPPPATGGSSPLARGLPKKIPTAAGHRGIIPARAGFTGDPAQEPPVPGDHPRSRGVYLWYVLGTLRGPGSSPLARGLRGEEVSDPVAAGIIPARAGFTQGRQLQGAGGGDHPRSRGVYDSASTARWISAGSSPLARGLPPAEHQDHQR